MIAKYPELEKTTGAVDFNDVDDIVRSKECKEALDCCNEQGGKMNKHKIKQGATQGVEPTTQLHPVPYCQGLQST